MFTEIDRKLQFYMIDFAYESRVFGKKARRKNLSIIKSKKS